MENKIQHMEGGIEENSVESQANSQENPSLLLMSRLRNPVIFNQIVLLYKKFYEPKFPEKDIEAKIRTKLNERIEAIENSTPINLDADGKETSGGGGTFFDDEIKRELIKTPYIPEDYSFDPSKTVQGQSIFESHEKGHTVRYFDGSYFREYFKPGFDIDACEYDRERTKNLYLYYEKKVPTEEEISGKIKEGLEYLFSGSEIAERMSQLKSYFGMKGNEKFTLEHLTYARKHYIVDTGADNNMRLFFSAITKETEPKFIQLINSSGI